MDKLPPVNLNISLGTTSDALARRKAYDEAAAKRGFPVTKWARWVLDLAAKFTVEK